ncbi:hypothetical protein BGZ58_000837 [Dissophora ornata]|nr:hypothetical protein BGZ58_000837 [Dissophora ornata]
MQQRPGMVTRLSSKAKFFVSDEESEDEDEEDREDHQVSTEVSFIKATSIRGPADRQDDGCEHSGREGQDEDEDKDRLLRRDLAGLQTVELQFGHPGP